MRDFDYIFLHTAARIGTAALIKQGRLSIKQSVVCHNHCSQSQKTNLKVYITKYEVEKRVSSGKTTAYTLLL